MATRNQWSVFVTNDYLRRSREVKGSTEAEARLKAAEQVRRWRNQELLARERERIADLRERAEFETGQAAQELAAYRGILSATLSMDDRLDWESLKDKTPFGEIAFTDPEPTIQDAAKTLGVSLEPSLVQRVLGLGTKKRKQLLEQADALLAESLLKWQVDRQNTMREHAEAKAEFEKRQAEQNNSLDQLRGEFELSHGGAIEKYVHIVLERSEYPDAFEREYEVAYDPIGETLIVSYDLPQQESVPHVVGHKYIASRKAIDEIEMKQKEFDGFYEDVLYQVCLRTIHEVFESVQLETLKSVVFNGWVSGIDAKTGNEFRSCVISCQAARSEFETLNLERVSPKECFRHLKGLAAGPLAQLAPVKPIMELRRDDPRFIESQDVMSGFDSATNLATIEWEAFEHLVRQLFEQIFAKTGGEVRVTQASRDRGVDAIAFDPDPIRGGKIVIQAKRYNNVVPVSAVRDLYGTVMNEGATKGILVTTSHYGNDSREFAKDKPLTLIDGPNLVYLLSEHGHNYTIQLQGHSNVTTLP